MICVDNSEWMRNGDYSPTRLQAQADAVNLICGAKTQVTEKITPFILKRFDFWTFQLELLKGLFVYVVIFVDMGVMLIQSNPENTVGVLTMAGNGVRVLVTPTSDLGKILACMHGKLFASVYTSCDVYQF